MRLPRASPTPGISHGAPLSLGPATDQERALLSVLRLLDRSLCHVVLSPVDRAFVAGAKSTFEQLATECEHLPSSGNPPGPSRVRSPTPAPSRNSVAGGVRSGLEIPPRTRSRLRAANRLRRVTVPEPAEPAKPDEPKP